MNKVKIAVCQTKVVKDNQKNLEHVLQKIEHAIANKAQVVVLPEMFLCPYDIATMPQNAITSQSHILKQLKKSSQNILLVAGSVPEKSGKKIYNTCFVYEKGELLGKHRKFHLFNIDIPGEISFYESKIFTAGEEVTVLDSSFGKIGIVICFDVRFPELFKIMAFKGAKMIFAPGAFNTVTGPLHWELSLRARAVDSQCFVIACSPARSYNANYKAWGHSTIIHPMGHVMEMLGARESMIIKEIDLNEVDKTRQELPLLSQTRLL